MTAQEYLTQMAHMRREVHCQAQQAQAILELQQPWSVNLAENINLLHNRSLEVLELLDKLENPEHRTLLTLRYIRDMQWKEVSLKMNYSTRHLNRMHKSALEMLDGKMKDKKI